MSNKFALSFVIILALITCLLKKVSGQDQLKFTSFTTKNGLSGNTVNVILQDHKGFIWFGTNNGLNKFDGTNCTIYTHNKEDSTSIPANEIVALLEDRWGKLWVGTGGGGLAYYDQQKNSFVSYNIGIKNNKDKITTARAFCEDYEGKLWVGSYEGIKIVDTRKKTAVNLNIKRLLNNPINTLVVLTLFEDDKKRMWIGTNAGLLLYDKKNNKISKFLHAKNDLSSLSGNEVRSITQDKEGKLFFGTANGLSMLLPNEKKFRVFHHSDQQSNSISSDVIYEIKAAPSGKIWIGTEEGLSIFDSNNFASTNIKPDKRKSFSITNKSIRSLFFAKKNIVWLGTYQGGVNKYDPNLPLLNLKKSFPFDPKGLSSQVITAFAEYKKEGIFVGTDGGGLNYFNRKSGLLDHYDIKSEIDHSGNPLSILALDLDAEKNLWIGTYQNGLFFFNPETGNYKQYLSNGTGKGLSQNNIFFINHDSKGLIWIGTNGYGVDVFNPTNQIFTNFSRSNVKRELQLPLNGFMRAMAEDSTGNIWLGSAGTGLAVYNPTKKDFVIYNKENSQLSNDVVLSILHDRSGNTWVGTSSGGLNLFNKKNHKFTHFSEADGFANGVVYKILEDNAGIIWISTDKGISSINPKTKSIKNFGVANGVQDVPFISGSGISSSDGELFFGGQDGFNYFLPSKLPINNTISNVILTDLKVNNNTIIPGQHSPLHEQINTAKDIYLDYGQNFSISYVVLSYTAPQQNKYAYQLSGFDKQWNNVGREKTAYYTNLDPGKYVFRVRASNNEGIWSNKITEINIHVKPPIWRTIYAYIAYILLFVCSLLYIRRRGIQKIKNEIALEQEKVNAAKLIEQERKEAEQIHELDLQKIKFLTNLSHEFRTPISLILAPVDKLLASNKDAAVVGQVTMIRRNARRLLNLVNQLLDFRKMEEQELKLNLSQGDLVTFIKETTESFHDLSDRKKIALVVESEIASFPFLFDHDKIERIIFNLLSNAFKFTYKGGEINVHMSIKSVDQQEPVFCITVADTGIGIHSEIQQQIFERFFMANKVESILNQGSGIGLSITREFVHLHGGEISVESQPNKGTIFSIILPVKHNDIVIYNEVKDDINDESLTLIEEVITQPSPVVDDKLATLLLVEDNDEFRYHLRDSLQDYYQIIEASNGKEGWQKALSFHPQLIVSDINMPYMNGIELSQKIKSDKRTEHIPVILLTASNAEEDEIRGLESGANDYLTKPFNFEILNTKIKNQLIYNRSLKDTYSKQIQVTGKEIEIESTDVKLLNTIVQYIDDKLNDAELSVEELSRHVGMSRGSLYHKLLELTGLTPIEYIRSVKLERAVALLEKSDYNISQIAYMTGFGTPSYFSRIFKMSYNILPSEYISANRKNRK